MYLNRGRTEKIKTEQQVPFITINNMKNIIINNNKSKKLKNSKPKLKSKFYFFLKTQNPNRNHIYHFVVVVLVD
jgi:hypothetical protein